MVGGPAFLPALLQVMKAKKGDEQYLLPISFTYIIADSLA
jgi:hypothetical protein